MDVSRLAHLIDCHAASLELYARQWCDSPEDAVQEAFVKLASLRQEPEHPAAWLFRAVRNRAINLGIASERRRRHEQAHAVTVPSWFEPASQAETIDPDTATRALEALPDDQREAIVAHLWGGLSFEQVAALMGSSSSTAHRLYHAGLSTLRERLEVPCPTTNPSRMNRD